MGHNLRHAGLGLTLACLAATPLHAAQTLQAYEFTAVTDGPITSHSGSFTYLYDDVTFTPTLQSIDFSVAGTVFTTANAAMISYEGDTFVDLYLFGAPSYPVTIGVNDFILVYRIVGRSIGSFGYTTVGFDTTGADFRGGSLTLNPVAVPEPASWALMILGLGMTGTVVRRGRRGRATA